MAVVAAIVDAHEPLASLRLMPIFQLGGPDWMRRLARLLCGAGALCSGLCWGGGRRSGLMQALRLPCENCRPTELERSA